MEIFCEPCPGTIWELATKTIERLPSEVAATRIGMVHIPGPTTDREARLIARFPGCDAVVYGHTHVPEARQHDGVWILNPGSPTERRRAPHRSLLMLEIAAGTIAPTLVTLP